MSVSDSLSKRVLLSLFGLICLVVLVWLNRQNIRSIAEPSAEYKVPQVEKQTGGKAAPVRVLAGLQESAGSPATVISVPAVDSGLASLRSGGSYTKESAKISNRATMELWVVDKKTQQPAPSCRLICFTEEPSASPAFDGGIGPEGYLLLEILAGKYTLSVQCPGYFKWESPVQVQSNQEHIKKTVLLSKATVVHGLTKNAKGQPLRGANLVAYQGQALFRAESGTDGMFEIQVLPQAIDMIWAVKPPHPIASMGPIPIEESARNYVELALSEDLPVRKLSGRVLDHKGQPVQGAAVTVDTPSKISPQNMGGFWMAGRWLYPSAQTDAAGRFFLEVLPEPKARMEVSAEDFEPHVERLDTTRHIEKDIYLKRPKVFRVTVLDAGGRPLEGMTVVGVDDQDDLLLQPTSRDGIYFSTKYPFRIYAEDVGRNRGITRSRWIDSHQEEIVLFLAREQISGTVTDESGKPLTNFAVKFYAIENASYAPTAAYWCKAPDGAFTLKNLPSGRATVAILTLPDEHASMARREAEQVIIVEEGRTAEVRFVLKR